MLKARLVRQGRQDLPGEQVPPVPPVQRDLMATTVMMAERDLLEPQVQPDLLERVARLGLRVERDQQVRRGRQEIPVLPAAGGVLNINSPLLQRWETRLRAITGSTTRLSPACPR